MDKALLLQIIVLLLSVGLGGCAQPAPTAPMAGGSMDVVGAQGPQDDIAREIYRPGSRPAGW